MERAGGSGRPRDPPATTFEEDPIILDLLSENRPPYFGLGLVTGWPPSPNLVEPYNEFLRLVKQCFDSTDISGETPSVYLYTSTPLHVTVATLHPVQKVILQPSESNDEKIENGARTSFRELEEQWKNFVRRASKRSSWPTASLQFEIDSCQIGSKAGILLWRETTGGLANIRSCLSQEAAESRPLLHIHSIPNIVHTTFLRFYQVPSTKGELVQSKMRSIVIPQIQNIFSQAILTQDIKLVCERSPYMHITNDEHHVLSTVPLC